MKFFLDVRPLLKAPAKYSLFLIVTAWVVNVGAGSVRAEFSVARQWNDALLDSIRIDFPAPTVHSRNLYHTSAAMYDAWATYDPQAQGHFVTEKHTSATVESSRAEAMSFAAYRLLSHRYAFAVNPVASQQRFDTLMDSLHYDRFMTDTTGDSPAAVGNRIASEIIRRTEGDGSNENHPTAPYSDNTGYTALSAPMIVDFPAVTVGPLESVDPNHWQPLFIDSLVVQNGIPLGFNLQKYVGPHWGNVTTFALGRNDSSGPHPWSSIDPGPPPQFGGSQHQQYVDNAMEVIRFSNRLDPNQGTGSELINISPAVYGNRPLGTHDNQGHALNPVSQQPYADNWVKSADYGRVLAEFWADGPASETPPGHWNVLANQVSNHPGLEKRIGGVGPVVNDLEWDAKLYFALNGAVHDAGVAAWGVKREYDYARPITMIRYLATLGQSSDSNLPSFDPNGLPLEAGLVELMTADSIAEGGRHHNAFINANLDDDRITQQFVSPAEMVGKLAILAWNHQPEDPANQTSGVDWIMAENWVPYQNDNFVTPAFAAYVSGHSAFSRAAAEVLAQFTGSEYFPEGLGSMSFSTDFLRFEDGPSANVELQWATYFDAADEAGRSRLWGGIHVAPDDFAGRIMGHTIGLNAYDYAISHFHTVPEPTSLMLLILALAGTGRLLCGRRGRQA